MELFAAIGDSHTGKAMTVDALTNANAVKVLLKVLE
jgi:hypothetical protein